MVNSIRASGFSGLHWTGLHWTGLEWNGLEWNGLEWKLTLRYRHLRVKYAHTFGMEVKLEPEEGAEERPYAFSMEVGEIKLEPKEGTEERPILLDEVTYESRTLLEEGTDENPILLDLPSGSVSHLLFQSPVKVLTEHKFK